METETLIGTLIGLILAAYAFIFKDIRDRISDLEDLPVCEKVNCFKKFDKIEEKVEKMNPVYEDIKERLVRIETILEEMRKK